MSKDRIPHAMLFYGLCDRCSIALDAGLNDGIHAELFSELSRRLHNGLGTAVYVGLEGDFRRTLRTKLENLL